MLCIYCIRLFKLAYKLLPLAFIIWLRLEETEVTETHGRAITMVRHVSKGFSLDSDTMCALRGSSASRIVILVLSAALKYMNGLGMFKSTAPIRRSPYYEIS